MVLVVIESMDCEFEVSSANLIEIGIGIQSPKDRQSTHLL